MGTMYDAMVALSKTTNQYTIPLMPKLDWRISNGIISGPTGSGKTYLLNVLLAIASIKGCYLMLADPKCSDLASLSAFMPAERVAAEPQQIMELAENAVELMRQRYRVMKDLRADTGLFQADYSDFGFCPALFCIDEMAAFVSGLDKKQQASFNSCIKALTLQGRQAGTVLLSIMQQPNTTNISSESRSQAGLRIMLGNSTSTEYKMLFGEGFDAPNYPRKPGHGFCMIAGTTSAPIRFEAPLMDKAQIADTMRQALAVQWKVDPMAVSLARSEAEGEASGFESQPKGANRDYDLLAPVPSANQSKGGEENDFGF